MKRLLVATIILLIVGCAGNAEGTTAVPHTPFTLREGQSTQIDGTAITVRFDKVTKDDRCPTGWECEYGGVAAISLTVTSGDSAETIELYAPGSSDLYGFAAEAMAAGYTLHLDALEPYPQNPDDALNGRYTATLTVTP